MKHFRNGNRLRRMAAVAALLMLPLASMGQVELFSGLDFNYRDINYVRQYDVLLNLTPGFKWHMSNHWMLSGSAIVPVINQYGNEYERIRPDMLVVSREADIYGLYVKGSAGLFSLGRYGVDAKAFLPLADWIAFEGQAGYTGMLTFATGCDMSPMDRLSWTLGGDLYFAKKNFQMRGIIGHYVFGDLGFEGEMMRHFNHTTVILHGRWSSRGGLDAGFKFVAMIPPYQRPSRRWIIRPASNFRFTNSIKYHIWNNRMYKTDPEENERDGWFGRDLLEWGSHSMEPDFVTKKKGGAQ